MPIGASGIKVVFHASAFNSAIDRHGQYVRWYSSLPCTCMDELGRANPNHRECFGRGLIYFPIIEKRILEEAFSYGGREIHTSGKIKRLISVAKTQGEPLAVSSYRDNVIVMQDLLNRGSYYQISYVVDLLEDFAGAAHYLGKGIIEVPLTPEVISEGTFIGLITKVNSLLNVTKDKPISVQSFWENRIYTKDVVEETDVLAIDCEMIKPTKMLITSVKGAEPGSPMYSKDANKMAAWQDCDAVCTYPGYMVIGQNDLITLLRAEQKTSAVGLLGSGDETYKVPYFHLRDLISVRDELGEVSDVSIIRQNELLFGDRKPQGRFSFSFTYLPTFNVSGDSAVLRYAENKEFPKRIGLKRYDAASRNEMRPTSVAPSFTLRGDSL